MGCTTRRFVLGTHAYREYLFRGGCRGNGRRDIHRSCGGSELLGWGFGGLAEDFVGHLRIGRAAQGFFVEVGIIEFAVDLSSLDLAEGDLLLDINENHEEMLALLGICSVIVGHCDDCTIVLHNDGREL